MGRLKRRLLKSNTRYVLWVQGSKTITIYIGDVIGAKCQEADGSQEWPKSDIKTAHRTWNELCKCASGDTVPPPCIKIF
jgi:hypothetical protein